MDVSPIYCDPAVDECERRSLLYDGAIVVLSPNGATSELCAFAREVLCEAFAGTHPQTAQHDMPLEAFAALISDVKSRFIKHPRAKELVRDVLSSLGCDIGRTYYDAPRLRTSRSVGNPADGTVPPFAVRGLHRDTWYSAPMGQLNFWLPVFPVEPSNGLAFHVGYFDQPVSNSSATYDHRGWNSKRRFTEQANTDKLNKEATRGLPRALEPIEMARTVVPVPPVGGVINFSGQHLHSSVVNNSGRSRYSIDFRIVHVDDAIAGRSAPNVDAACTGSAFSDFVCAADFSAMPAELVEQFNEAAKITSAQPHG
jgi:hypothetical protein